MGTNTLPEDPQGPALRLVLAAVLGAAVLKVQGAALDDANHILCTTVAAVLVVEWLCCGRRWYDWLCGSGLAKYGPRPSRAFSCDRRGFGDGHDRLWGCVPVPALSVRSMDALLLCIAAPLWFMPHTQLARGLAAGAAHVYIGNLQTHKTGGQHGILVLHVLALQALRADGEGELCLLCTRAVVLSLYLGAAVSKLVASGVRWCDGGTLQRELFESAFLVPGAFPGATRYVASHRALCCVASTLTVAVEFVPLVVFLATRALPLEWLYVPVHVAVYVLMGVDFVTWWVPVLVVLGAFAKPGALPDMTFPWMPLYVFIQLAVALASADLRRGAPCFPFTCCPMFCDHKELFAGAGTWTLTDSQLPGLLTPWYPPSYIQGKFTQDELHRLPYRYVSFSFGAGEALALTRLRPGFERKRDQTFANLEVTKNLRDRLLDGARFVKSGEAGWAWDQARMKTLLAHQRAIRDAMRDACAGAPPAGDSGAARPPPRIPPRNGRAPRHRPVRLFYFIYASGRRAPDNRGLDGASSGSPDSLQLP